MRERESDVCHRDNVSLGAQITGSTEENNWIASKLWSVFWVPYIESNKRKYWLVIAVWPRKCNGGSTLSSGKEWQFSPGCPEVSPLPACVGLLSNLIGFFHACAGSFSTWVGCLYVVLCADSQLGSGHLRWVKKEKVKVGSTSDGLCALWFDGVDCHPSN